MTYNVFGGTLSLTQPTNQTPEICRWSVVIVHSYLVNPTMAEPARKTTVWLTKERQVNTASQCLVDWRLVMLAETLILDLQNQTDATTDD